MSATFTSNSATLTLTDNGQVSLSGSEACFILPNYPTASLPSASVEGSGACVYDSDAGTLKFSNGSAWIAVPQAGTIDYTYQVLPSGSIVNYTIPNGITTIILDCSNVTYSATAILPSSPSDGQVITVTFTKNVAGLLLSVQPNIGQKGGGSGSSNGSTYMYRSADSTWYGIL